MKKNKKDILAAILGIVVTAAVVLAVVAVIILIDAGLLCLLGVRSASFGHLVGYVLLASVVGLPLELFTNGLAGCPVSIGLGQPQNGKSAVHSAGYAVLRPCVLGNGSSVGSGRGKRLCNPDCRSGVRSLFPAHREGEAEQ